MPKKHRPIRTIAPYFVALLSVGVVALALLQWSWLFERGAFALLLGCVFVSTWFGGWRSGLVAIFLSVTLSAYLMVPSNSFRIDQTQDWIRLFIFIAVAAMIALVHASRARAVEAARVSGRRLTAALDAARMGAWDKNLKDGAFWWSQGLIEIFGRKPGAYVPTYDQFLGYIHPEDREFVTNAFTRSVEKSMEFEIEHRIVRPDGGVRWVITRGRILYDTNGIAERLLGVAVDVTDRHSGNEPDSGSGEMMTALKGRL